jgi:hypothetical protein
MGGLDQEMKYILIFSAVWFHTTAELADLDRSNSFHRYRSCWGYARKIAPEMEKLMRDYFALEPNVKVTWKCRRSDR